MALSGHPSLCGFMSAFRGKAVVTFTHFRCALFGFLPWYILIRGRGTRQAISSRLGAPNVVWERYDNLY